jgi:hypothetical protein
VPVADEEEKKKKKKSCRKGSCVTQMSSLIATPRFPVRQTWGRSTSLRFETGNPSKTQADAHERGQRVSGQAGSQWIARMEVDRVRM